MDAFFIPRRNMFPQNSQNTQNNFAVFLLIRFELLAYFFL